MSTGQVPSDSDNFVGNDITNTSFLHGLYILSGTGHFLYGNNVQGTITPSGTGALPDSTYYLSSKPFFWDISTSWPDIGTPYNTANETNPALERYNANEFTLCENQIFTAVPSIKDKIDNDRLRVYPNPFADQLTLSYYAAQDEKAELRIYDDLGIIILEKAVFAEQGLNSFYINTNSYISGFYFVTLMNDTSVKEYKCIKL
jgi:hypothetical protein